jgi:carboxypeptidase C (cathepsin A)
VRVASARIAPAADAVSLASDRPMRVAENAMPAGDRGLDEGIMAIVADTVVVMANNAIPGAIPTPSRASDIGVSSPVIYWVKARCPFGQETSVVRPSVILALLAGLSVSASAQGRGAPPPASNEPSSAGAAREEYAGPAEEKISQTSHSFRLDGREIRYTATTGTLPIRLDNGQVAARMFFVAYTKDGEDPKTRPVSFLYNGGPGAATVWLHMGSFAPKHVQMAADGFQPAPPYHLVDNENSLLDATDLVFIDAVSTGFSRTVAGVSSAQFHGQTNDLRAFGEFINTYLSAYSRWPSPKYLIGESYGTIRSAGLSQELQSRHGVELNGIVLISSLLTYQTLSPAPDNDVAYESLIESFTADAWYHKKLPPDLQQQSLKQVVDQARTFAFGEYAQALTRGNTLSDAERKAMALKVARLSGLSAKFVEEANLRVSAGRFRKELLRDQRLTIGRLDGRFTAIDLDAAGEQEEFDPSNTALQGGYTALFQDYVKNELKWESDLHYPTSGNVRPWTYDENSYMDMTEPLRSAMTRNPFLKVFVACGYYDMATVMGGSEFNFTHLAYDKQVTDRVSFGYYEAGHMIYIRPSAHKALKQDIARFIAGTSSAARP